VADGTSIDAADHNTPLLDIETALSATILRNAAAPFTGNQSMGNNKLVNLADGTVATDAPTLRQAQSGVASVATAVGGTANAVTLTFSPPFATYVNNMTVGFRIGTTNTGAVTVNVDGLGAKSFRKDASGTIAELISGEAQAGMFVEARFNTAADCFVWVNQKPVFLASDGKIGIGTPSPAGALDVRGFARFGSYGGVFQGVTLVNNDDSAAADTVSFIDAHNNLLIPDSNLFFRHRLDGSSSIEFATTPAGARNSDRRVGRVQITGSGKAIVGATDNGAFNLQCNGTGVWGAGAYVNGSDERIKDEIAPIGSCLDVVNDLNPITFRYKSSWSTDQSIQPGFSAQELLQALAGTNYAGGVVQQGPEYYSVAYQALIPVLTKALQEAIEKINALTARVAALEAGQP
jgi:hypothetical protein